MNTKYPVSTDSITKTILESISDGVFTVDCHWRITSFNRAAEEITSIPRDEAIGRYCWEVFRANMCEKHCALKRTMAEEKSFISSSTYIINGGRQMVPIQVSTSLLKNDQDEIIGGVETFRDLSIVEELRREISGSYECGDMISKSKSMRDLFTIISQVAESDSTVLIEGETGTGKELLARAIHKASLRRKNPFIAVNCGALPDSLLESELFGYKAGAFTDARGDKQGLFGAAESGTLFLDEIGDTSSAFQVRLLRVLEEHEYQPLGSTQRQKARCRIIAATNRDLEQLVDESVFRQDLYYRINVLNLKLPPLRERAEDIELLSRRFLSKLNTLKGKNINDIDPKAMKLLLTHDYPGNIRELENIIEHAFVLCTDDVLSLDHLPTSMRKKYPAEDYLGSFQSPLQDAERGAILHALEQTNFNRTRAASLLNIHKSTLFRKMKKLGIHHP